MADEPTRREEHRRAIYIVGSEKRRKRTGLRLMCTTPECGGEMFAPGISVADVVAAADAHIDEAEADRG